VGVGYEAVCRASGWGPVLGERCGLFEDGLGSLFCLVKG